jgi:hypothetical protein
MNKYITVQYSKYSIYFDTHSELVCFCRSIFSDPCIRALIRRSKLSNEFSYGNLKNLPHNQYQNNVYILAQSFIDELVFVMLKIGYIGIASGLGFLLGITSDGHIIF